MLTLEQAKNLRYGQEIYDTVERNADGTPWRWRVTGKVKTWKRPANARRVKVPIKRGMYDFSHVTEHNLEYFCLTEEQAMEDNRE